MKRLAYIRLVTYALLALAFLMTRKKHAVIPVQLTHQDEDAARLIDAAIIKRQDKEDIARTPGFEATKRSGSEVLRIAIERAQKEGVDFNLFRKPTITLLNREGKMKWLVSWTEKGSPRPGGFFSILVDDESGDTDDLPGM